MRWPDSVLRGSIMQIPYKIQSRVANRGHNEDPIALLSQAEKQKPEPSCFLVTSALFKWESFGIWLPIRDSSQEKVSLPCARSSEPTHNARLGPLVGESRVTSRKLTVM